MLGRLVNSQMLLLASFLGLKPRSPGIHRMDKGKTVFEHAFKSIAGSVKLGVCRGAPCRRAVSACCPVSWQPSLPLATRETG